MPASCPTHGLTAEAHCDEVDRLRAALREATEARNRREARYRRVCSACKDVELRGSQGQCFGGGFHTWEYEASEPGVCGGYVVCDECEESKS